MLENILANPSNHTIDDVGHQNGRYLRYLALACRVDIQKGLQDFDDTASSEIRQS